MPGSPIDSVFILYNRGKLISSREENHMKLKKSSFSIEGAEAYDVSFEKSIIIFTEDDHSIESICLAQWDEPQVRFEPKGLWYLENITDDDGTLDVDSLMIMIAQEEHGCVRA